MNFIVESYPQYIMSVIVKQVNNVDFSFLEKHYIHLSHF